MFIYLRYLLRNLRRFLFLNRRLERRLVRLIVDLGLRNKDVCLSPLKKTFGFIDSEFFLYPRSSVTITAFAEA